SGIIRNWQGRSATSLTGTPIPVEIAEVVSCKSPGSCYPMFSKIFLESEDVVLLKFLPCFVVFSNLGCLTVEIRSIILRVIGIIQWCINTVVNVTHVSIQCGSEGEIFQKVHFTENTSHCPVFDINGLIPGIFYFKQRIYDSGGLKTYIKTRINIHVKTVSTIRIFYKKLFSTGRDLWYYFSCSILNP